MTVDQSGKSCDDINTTAHPSTPACLSSYYVQGAVYLRDEAPMDMVTGTA